MIKVQILGGGCAKCTKLAETAKTAAEQLGLACEFEKITEIKRYADFGVMFTPALVVDGVVKVSGRVPSLDEVKQMLG